MRRKDLVNFFDSFRTGKYDFHRVNLKNVNPSRDDYDVVVRKELRDFGAEIQRQVEVGIGGDKATFGFAIDSNLLVGTNLCPPYICVNKLKPVKVYAIPKIAAVGSSIIVDLKVNGVSIFPSPLIIPEGNGVNTNKVVTTTTSFAVGMFNELEIITGDILQVGSQVPGQSLVVVLKMQGV
jgi:hypothetical protein